MNEFDDKIRQALAAEEAALFEELGEPALTDQVLETFRGRSRWLVGMVFAMTFAWLGVAILCAVRFFASESQHAVVGWAAGFGVSILAVAMLKIWYWIELAKNNVTREVKRMELQLAYLASKIGKPAAP